MVWRYFGVIPILFGWFLRVLSPHALVFFVTWGYHRLGRWMCVVVYRPIAMFHPWINFYLSNWQNEKTISTQNILAYILVCKKDSLASFPPSSAHGSNNIYWFVNVYMYVWRIQAISFDACVYSRPPPETQLHACNMLSPPAQLECLCFRAVETGSEAMYIYIYIYIYLARFCNVLVDSTKDVLVGWQWYEWGDVWLLYQFIDVGERALAHVSIQMVRRGSLLKRKPDNALYNSSLTTTCDVVSVVHVRQQGWEFLSCSSWQQSSIQRAYYGLVTRESPYTVHLHFCVKTTLVMLSSCKHMYTVNMSVWYM